MFNPDNPNLLEFFRGLQTKSAAPDRELTPLVRTRLHQPIFHSEDPVDGFYLIVEGNIAITDDKDRLVALCECPSLIGDIEVFLAQSCREWGTVAIERAAIIEFSPQILAEALQNLAFERWYAGNVARRLLEINRGTQRLGLALKDRLSWVQNKVPRRGSGRPWPTHRLAVWCGASESAIRSAVNSCERENDDEN